MKRLNDGIRYSLNMAAASAQVSRMRAFQRPVQPKFHPVQPMQSLDRFVVQQMAQAVSMTQPQRLSAWASRWR